MCSPQAPGQGKSFTVNVVYSYLVDSVCALCFGHQEALAWPALGVLTLLSGFLFPCCLSFFISLLFVPWISLSQRFSSCLTVLKSESPGDILFKSASAWSPLPCFNCSEMGPEPRYHSRDPRDSNM